MFNRGLVYKTRRRWVLLSETDHVGDLLAGGEALKDCVAYSPSRSDDNYSHKELRGPCTCTEGEPIIAQATR